MVGIQSVAQMTAWLAVSLVTGPTLFFLLDLLGVVCFSYIVTKRMVPLLRGQRDFRFDRPLSRIGAVLKFWLGQWKQPRYPLAGVLHICLFAGFLVLLVHSFSLVIVGISTNFVMPGFSGRVGDVYNILKDYAATLVFISVAMAAIRRAFFKPARYAVPAKYGRDHTAEAVFILGLIATLMLADGLFEASEAAAQLSLGLHISHDLLVH